jgi:hypothetical protein
MNEYDLQSLFAGLDSLHFNGQLQAEGWRVLIGQVIHENTGNRCQGYCSYSARLIVIDPSLRNPVRDTLLHQMAHALSMDDDERLESHGRKWQRVMGRLVYRGEHQLMAELRAYGLYLKAWTSHEQLAAHSRALDSRIKELQSQPHRVAPEELLSQLQEAEREMQMLRTRIDDWEQQIEHCRQAHRELLAHEQKNHGL